MSRQKPDKFTSKLSGCFPVKGCLQRHSEPGSRRPTAISRPIITPTTTSQPTILGATPLVSDARMEHTKQWLQNLSTVVNYDQTLMESPTGLSEVTCHGGDGSYIGWNDSPESAADRTMQGGCGEKDCCCRKNAPAQESKHHQQCHCDADSSILSDVKPRFDDSAMKAKLGDSSYMSTSTVANSSMLSSKCCSQHRGHRSRRQVLSSTAVHINGGGPGANPPPGSINNDCESSIASSSVSLTTELVTLNLSEGRPLGITIVGHSSGQRGGDCGIFVGCVKRGGAAAADGRIEPGDLILEVNGKDLEGLTNERALTILRGELARGGTVQILVAKYWDMEDPDDCRREPIYEPVGSVRSSVVGARPMSEWNGAARPLQLKAIPEDGVRPRLFREASGASNSESDNTSNNGRFSSLLPAMRNQPVCQQSSQQQRGVTPTASMPSLAEPHYVSRSHSASRHSTIDRHRGGSVPPTSVPTLSQSQPSADEPFLGVDLVNWIRSQVTGLSGNSEAFAYANDLLQAGYIYTVNRPHQQNAAGRFQFREDDYYVFGRAWDDSEPKRILAHRSGAYL